MFSIIAHTLTSALGARSSMGVIGGVLNAMQKVNDAVRAPRAYLVVDQYVEVVTGHEWDVARDGREAVEALTAIPGMQRLLSRCAKGYAEGRDLLAPFEAGGLFEAHASTPAVAAELTSIRKRLTERPELAQRLLAFGQLACRSERQRAERAAQTTE